MLFEGNLGNASERSGTGVPLKNSKKCRLVGGGGRALQGAKFESERLQTSNTYVLTL